MTELAYLRNQFVPLSEATVSINDRGFVFADGVYEVIAVYRGRPFRLEEHWQRLSRSAGAIRLHLPLDFSQLEAIISEGLSRTQMQEVQIYIQVTRGEAPRSHAFPTGTEANLVVTFGPRTPLPAHLWEEGVAVITTEDIRWKRCDIKSIGLLPNVLAKQEAEEKGAFEALLVSEEGILREGSTSNLFMVLEDVVRTPPQDRHILGGITRDAVLQCARELGQPVAEEVLTLDHLFRAQEVFLTGTRTEVLGVVEVDKKTIGQGKVGPVTRRLRMALRKMTRGSDD